jgi:hypothetical protein
MVCQQLSLRPTRPEGGAPQYFEPIVNQYVSVCCHVKTDNHGVRNGSGLSSIHSNNRLFARQFIATNMQRISTSPLAMLEMFLNCSDLN